MLEGAAAQHNRSVLVLRHLISLVLPRPEPGLPLQVSLQLNILLLQEVVVVGAMVEVEELEGSEPHPVIL